MGGSRRHDWEISCRRVAHDHVGERFHSRVEVMAMASGSRASHPRIAGAAVPGRRSGGYTGAEAQGQANSPEVL